jgi:transglutaminase-like putative cysteine protease
VSTPLSVVLEGRRGVCQDVAHLATGCRRTRGLAARDVSGYMETDALGPARSCEDVWHASCSLWVPQQGWIEFDPTNDDLPADHVTLAWGRDHGDVTPVCGVGPPWTRRGRWR